MSARLVDRIKAADLVKRTGRVTRISPSHFEADGPSVPLGTLCHVLSRGRGAEPLLAEVVGVGPSAVRLAPLGSNTSTFPGALVTATPLIDRVAVGDGFLGRAVDGLGQPIDGGAPIKTLALASLNSDHTTPLARTSPKTPLATGIRVIDGLLPLGRGQRIGVFAAAGVGKTSLLAQLANQVQVDRCVIGLVGERGREVEALWSSGLHPQIKARTALLAATSDHPAALRVRAVWHALALAEHWRAEGHHVLLLLDSVTRLAMALRELGLAAGEPPTVRAYTPNVFAALPQVVERCGALRAGGSITAVMTVLSETDDVDDPICEMMKSLLDGHLILSRALAEQGHFPAIDIPRSISRLAPALMTPGQKTNADAARKALSLYEQSRTLIETGLYTRGANADLDEAIDLRPAILGFARQGQDERSAPAVAAEALAGIVKKAS